MIAACSVGATAAIVFNIFPIFMGEIAKQFAFNEVQMGYIGSAYLGGFAIPALFATYWIPRLRWKASITASLVVIAICLACLDLTSNGKIAYVIIALLGVANSINYSITLVIVSRHANPDRAFGFKLATEMSLATLVMYLMTDIIISDYGFAGFVYGMIVVYLLCCVPFLLLLPNYTPLADEADIQAAGQSVVSQVFSRAAIPVWLASTALFIQFGTLAALWGFSESIAAAAGIDDAVIGTRLTYAVFCGIIGAGAVAWLGNRLGTVQPLIAGFMVIIGMVTWVSQDTSLVVITIFMCITSAMIQYTAAYLMGYIADLDIREKFTPMIPFILACSGAVGPGVAGAMIEESGSFQSVYQLAISITVVSALLILVCARLERVGPK